MIARELVSIEEMEHLEAEVSGPAGLPESAEPPADAPLDLPSDWLVKGLPDDWTFSELVDSNSGTGPGAASNSVADSS